MKSITDLPIELQEACLLRVPYKFLQTCKAVCKEWKAIISSPDFYESRKTDGTSEKFICMVRRRIDYSYVITVYYPINNICESLPTFPFSSGIPYSCKVVYVNRKLFLIGGWHECKYSGKVAKSVFIYDFESAEWRRGAAMPTPRVSFACSASSSNGLIYVAGGNYDSQELASAEVYNVEDDKWEVLPPMPKNLWSCHGVFVEGKFMVISQMATESRSGGYNSWVEIYDPNLGIWSSLEQMWTVRERLWDSAYVGFCGNLFVFRKQEVRRYDAEDNVWTPVASLPRDFYYFECAAQWCDRIFVYAYPRPPNSHNLYMFQPSTQQLIAVDAPEELVGTVSSIATVEI